MYSIYNKDILFNIFKYLDFNFKYLIIDKYFFNFYKKITYKKIILLNEKLDYEDVLYITKIFKNIKFKIKVFKIEQNKVKYLKYIDTLSIFKSPKLYNLSELKNVRLIKINNCSNIIFETLNNLKKLKILELYGNHISNITDLNNKNLEQLFIYGTSIIQLPKIHNIKKLDLYYNIYLLYFEPDNLKNLNYLFIKTSYYNNYENRFNNLKLKLDNYIKNLYIY